ncbi:hypothetical protein P3342_010395 [Pyrenophora teres f. teres]|nr:hypothetical protein P3342_010395 [Pyrenophora teres f. teres]
MLSSSKKTLDKPPSKAQARSRAPNPADINDLDAFILAYKKLQSDNANLQVQVADQAATINQTQGFFDDAERALDELKAKDKEIERLRKKKIVVQEHNEDSMSKSVKSGLSYAKLTMDNQKLKKRKGPQEVCQD